MKYRNKKKYLNLKDKDKRYATYDTKFRANTFFSTFLIIFRFILLTILQFWFDFKEF